MVTNLRLVHLLYSKPVLHTHPCSKLFMLSTRAVRWNSHFTAKFKICYTHIIMGKNFSQPNNHFSYQIDHFSVWKLDQISSIWPKKKGQNGSPAKHQARRQQLSFESSWVSVILSHRIFQPSHLVHSEVSMNRFGTGMGLKLGLLIQLWETAFMTHFLLEIE